MGHVPRFKPAPYAVPGTPKLDEPGWIDHVIAVVSFPVRGAARREMIVGLDAGHVIRTIPMARARELPARAFAELEYHANHGEAFCVESTDVHLLDVQVVESVPDVPGADDPLYLYGVLRGPYPAALDDGVAGIEGRLLSSRTGVLDGFVLGLSRAFRYEPSPYGSRCVPLLLGGGDASLTRAGGGLVLAFPLAPPLGRAHDMANDLVAAQLAHDVIGAARRDLGDDLGTDPVPVPSREAYERELAAGGWVVHGKTATRKTKGRFSSLFTPAETQTMPAEATLPELAALVDPLIARMRTPSADVLALRALVDPPVAPPPPPPPKTLGPVYPPNYRPRPPTMQPVPRARTQSPGDDFLEWIGEVIGEMRSEPGRVSGAKPLFDFSDEDDDDQEKP